MNLHFGVAMGRAALAALIALSASSALAAPSGTISGVSVAKNPVTEGEPVTYIVSGTGQCSVRVGSSDNPAMYVNIKAGPFPLKAEVYGVKPGTYNLLAGPMNDGGNSINPQGLQCAGSATGKVTVIPKPVGPAAAAVLGGSGSPQIAQVAGLGVTAQKPACAAGYTEVKLFPGLQPEKGEIRCAKDTHDCPQGFTGKVDDATGKLVCTANTAPCPSGWMGSMVDGKLVCESAPQPQVYCPKATPDWKWGAAYYKEGWRFMGCRANLKPAY